MTRRVAPLFAPWLLAMIALPIVGWTLGPAARPEALTVATAAQALLVVALVARAWGAARAARTAAVVVALGWAAEAVGSRVGWPFGAYAYTGALRPQLGGVPLAVPLAWWAMLPPSWAVAEGLLASRRRGTLERLLFAAVAGAAMTAWDLFLDPQMVRWGMWRWAEPGAYFGIPLQNYAGWWLVAAGLTLVAAPRPLGVFAGPLLAVYALTAALEAVGLGLLWGLPGPALVGGLATAALVAGALARGWPRGAGAASRAATA